MGKDPLDPRRIAKEEHDHLARESQLVADAFDGKREKPRKRKRRMLRRFVRRGDKLVEVEKVQRETR